MPKHNPENERVKHSCAFYMEEARCYDDQSVDAALAAIHRVEAHTGFRNFKTFRKEHAVSFKHHPAKQLGARGGKLLAKVFKAAFAAVGLPYASPHRLRDTVSMLAQRSHLTVEELKAWSQNMGHESVSTTLTSYGPVSSHRQGELIRKLADGAEDTHTDVAKQLVRMAEALRRGL